MDAYYHTDSPEKIVLPGYEPDGQTDLAIEVLREAADSSDKPFCALSLLRHAARSVGAGERASSVSTTLFRDVDFPLPPNYQPENDPHADNWARAQAGSSASSLPEWMRVYYAMTANLDWNVGRLLAALDDAGLAREHDRGLYLGPRRDVWRAGPPGQEHLLRRGGARAVPGALAGASRPPASDAMSA